MLITCIPKHNYNIERARLIKESYNSFIYDDFFSLIKNINDKNVTIVEIWYPHHFPALIIAKFFKKETIYSPTTASINWFKIKKFYLISFKYTLRRVLNLFLEFIACLFANKIFVQDRGLVRSWRVFKNKHISVVNNLIPTAKVKNSKYKHYINCIALGNLEPHKVINFNLIDESINCYWYGRTKFKFPEKIKSNLFYQGLLNKQLIFDKMNEYDFVFHPSGFEGSPRVIYEAVSIGKKILVSKNIPGIKDITTCFPDLIFNSIENLKESSKIIKSLNDRIDQFNQKNIKNRKKYLMD